MKLILIIGVLLIRFATFTSARETIVIKFYLIEIIMFTRKIQGAILFSAACISAVYGSEVDAAEYKNKAQALETRAAELRAQAGKLMGATSNQYQKCLESNAQILANYQSARTEATATNNARTAACGSCNRAAVFTFPERPDNTCGSVTSESQGLYAQIASLAQGRAAALRLQVGANEERLRDIDLYLRLANTTSELRNEYQTKRQNILNRLAPLRSELASAESVFTRESARAAEQKRTWSNCLQSDVDANIRYSQRFATIQGQQFANTESCNRCDTEVVVVAKPALSACPITGVGEQLLQEAAAAESQAASYMAQWTAH